MVICVTGKIGSGKSTVSRMISEKTGYEIVDVDKVGHEALELDEVKSKILKEFGEEVFTDGEVDRKKLSDLVFKNPELLKKLEDILHPKMKEMVLKRLVGKNIVLDCALLERMKLTEFCDVVITVISDYDISRSRKPFLSDEKFRMIWNLQSDVNMIGIVIENNGSLDDLRRKVSDVLEMIL